jgi:cell division protein FtsL
VNNLSEKPSRQTDFHKALIAIVSSTVYFVNVLIASLSSDSYHEHQRITAFKTTVEQSV